MARRRTPLGKPQGGGLRDPEPYLVQSILSRPRQGTPNTGETLVSAFVDVNGLKGPWCPIRSPAFSCRCCSELSTTLQPRVLPGPPGLVGVSCSSMRCRQSVGAPSGFACDVGRLATRFTCESCGPRFRL